MYMFPNVFSCFTSINPFLDNSRDATKFEETMDLLITLFDFKMLGIKLKKFVHSDILPKISLSLFIASSTE